MSTENMGRSIIFRRVSLLLDIKLIIPQNYIAILYYNVFKVPPA